MPKKKLTKAERESILLENTKFLRKLLKKRTRIIGIDPGTIITGLYSSSPEEGEAITPNPRHHIVRRISIILNHMDKFTDDAHINLHTVAVIEDYAWSRSKMVQLAELVGALKVLLFESGIPYFVVAPTTLTKFVLGPSGSPKGGNKKALTMVEALDRWGIKFSDDNVCDSYCLMKFLQYLKAYIFEEKVEEFSSQNAKIKRRIHGWEIQMFEDFIVSRGDPIM